MPFEVPLSHQFSLKCYLDARKDPDVSAQQYRDLEALVKLFGLVDAEGTSERKTAPPERFDFPTRPPRLLIVEDEPKIAESLLKASLVAWGYPEGSIEIFQSGEEAIFYTTAHAVGIAFVDIRLSNPLAVRNVYVSGLKVLDAIKEASPGAKVIVISGYATYNLVRKAILEMGASYYLGKPFALEDVLRFTGWALEALLGTDVKRIIAAGAGRGTASSAGKSLMHILVVDDDLSVADSISAALCSIGYQALAVGGGEEALQELERTRYEAVVSDVRMPRVDGLALLRRIHQRGERIPVVMLTAVEDEDIANEAIRLGADSYLPKPCDMDLLQFTLEYSFAQRQKAGESQTPRPP